MVVADGPRGAMAGGALSKHPSCQPLRVNAKKKPALARRGFFYRGAIGEKVEAEWNG